MITFTGQYEGNNFVYSGSDEALRMQLISILNTPKGSRWYYPDYGSRLNEFRFSILNYYTINMIGNEIKEAVRLIDGVDLSNISFTAYKDGLVFDIELKRQSDTTSVKVTVVDGIAS